MTLKGVCKGGGKVMMQWWEQPKFDIVPNTMHQGMRNQDDNVLST